MARLTACLDASTDALGLMHFGSMDGRGLGCRAEGGGRDGDSPVAWRVHPARALFRGGDYGMQFRVREWLHRPAHGNSPIDTYIRARV